jgi:pimeloyl-ACP methyl ester carboxylesterase
LIKELNLDHPIIGGHSMGADTTFHLAAEFPQMARAIFLEDPPLVLPGEPLFDSEQTKGKDVGKMMRQFMMLFKLMPRFIAIPMAHKGSPTYPEDEILPWVASKKRMSFDFLNSMDKLDFNVSDPLEPFDHIQVPVLLFIGDKEKTKMSIVSKSTAAAVIKRNAGIQVVQLDGATHDIRRTRFDGYMPALRQFLAENCK